MKCLWSVLEVAVGKNFIFEGWSFFVSWSCNIVVLKYVQREIPPFPVVAERCYINCQLSVFPRQVTS